jgi:hypothetical protein
VAQVNQTDFYCPVRRCGARGPATKVSTNRKASLFLLVDELEVLGALESIVGLVLALDTLEAEHNLLGGLGLLVEDRLSLTTVTLLLAVVTALT